MAQPFVGEVRMFGGNFAPVGWHMCDGSLMPISENETLFNLIGTTFGGDGQETFGLPDLRGRVPIHQGSSFQLGELGGVENVTLTTNQIPIHTHQVQAFQGAGDQVNPGGIAPANSFNISVFINDPPTAPMAAAVGPVGGSQPHENMQPYLCVTFIISLFGIFPSQT